MTLQLLPSEFPNIRGKLYFRFYQCIMIVFLNGMQDMQFIMHIITTIDPHHACQHTHHASQDTIMYV
jgi:hypothetical protein